MLRGSLKWALRVLTLSLCSDLASSACPRKCQCLWRSSKITVDCADQGLAGVPSTVEKETQVLNISGNHISALSAKQFHRFELINLQRISVANCGLSQIDTHALYGLTNLVELDLSDNLLNEVPSSTLNDDVPSLMSLSLRDNVIPIVRAKAFHRLAHLQKLDLSGCQILEIKSGAFQGLDALQRIYLHSNKLTTLDSRELPPSLHGITVHDNRWECDCRLRGFRLWLTESNVPRIVEPICKGPRRLTGIRVPSLSLAEFACAPQLSPTSMYLTVPRGKNVSIVCRVSSDPISSVAWFFNGKRIAEEEEDDTKQQPHQLLQHQHQVQQEFSWPPYDQGSSLASAPIILNTNQGRRPGQRRRLRVIRHDEINHGETRSELVIQNTSLEDNGTYHCQAENKAARSVSNFTLHVTSHTNEPKILQLRLEYFVAVAVAVIITLVLAAVILVLLLVRLCRKRVVSHRAAVKKMASEKDSSSHHHYSNGKIAPAAQAKMPKHIQMGTGFKVQHPDRPDLLTDHGGSSGLASNGTLGTDTGTVSSADSSKGGSSVAHGSYRMAMENIIDDYRYLEKEMETEAGEAFLDMRSESGATPLIGRPTANNDLAGCLGKGRGWASARTSHPALTLSCLSYEKERPKSDVQQQQPQQLQQPRQQQQQQQPVQHPSTYQEFVFSGYPSDFGLPLRPQQHFRSSQHHSMVVESSSPYGRLYSSPSYVHTLPHMHSGGLKYYQEVSPQGVHHLHNLDPSQLVLQQQQYFLPVQYQQQVRPHHHTATMLEPDEKYPTTSFPNQPHSSKGLQSTRGTHSEVRPSSRIPAAENTSSEACVVLPERDDLIALSHSEQAQQPKARTDDNAICQDDPMTHIPAAETSSSSPPPGTSADNAEKEEAVTTRTTGGIDLVAPLAEGEDSHSSFTSCTSSVAKKDSGNSTNQQLDANSIELDALKGQDKEENVSLQSGAFEEDDSSSLVLTTTASSTELQLTERLKSDEDELLEVEAGERAMQIFQELDEAFTSLDKEE